MQIMLVIHADTFFGKHLRDSHNQRNKDLQEQFTILKKCRGKLECLIYEMLFIKDKKPKLNTQSDSNLSKTIYLVNTLYIPHCISFQSHATRLSHAFYYRMNSQESGFSYTNLKMTVSSKRHSKLLSLVFIRNCLSKTSVIRTLKLIYLLHFSQCMYSASLIKSDFQ